MKSMKGLPSGWVKFDGEYEKIFYDIETKDGEIFLRCYPNAGDFHTPKGQLVDGDDVLKVRVSEDNMLIWRD